MPSLFLFKIAFCLFEAKFNVNYSIALRATFFEANFCQNRNFSGSEGITPDTPPLPNNPPPSFLRREAPGNFLVRKSLIKKFPPDNPPCFPRKMGQGGGLSGVIPSNRQKFLHQKFFWWKIYILTKLSRIFGRNRPLRPLFPGHFPSNTNIFQKWPKFGEENRG